MYKRLIGFLKMVYKIQESCFTETRASETSEVLQIEFLFAYGDLISFWAEKAHQLVEQ